MKEELPSFISRQVEESRYFFLEVGPKKDARFDVVCGGYESCKPEYSIVRKDFQYIGIEYVISGLGEFRVNGESHGLRSGSLIGYCPQDDISIRSDRKSPLRKWFVDLVGDEVESLFAASPLGAGRVISVPGVKWVEEVFRQLMLFGGREDNLARRSCRLLVEHMLLQLEEEARKEQAPSNPALQTFLRCRECIEKNYLKLTSASELARLANVDQAYLSRLFQRFDEETPYRKLVRMKMNHAARILLDTGKAVKEVSDIVGYEDALHFSRVFKRTYGLSPRHFVEAMRRT